MFWKKSVLEIFMQQFSWLLASSPFLLDKTESGFPKSENSRTPQPSHTWQWWKVLTVPLSSRLWDRSFLHAKITNGIQGQEFFWTPSGFMFISYTRPSTETSFVVIYILVFWKHTAILFSISGRLALAFFLHQPWLLQGCVDSYPSTSIFLTFPNFFVSPFQPPAKTSCQSFRLYLDHLSF